MSIVTVVTCRLVALNFWSSECSFQYLGFSGVFTYEIWAEFKKSCGNTDREICSNTDVTVCWRIMGNLGQGTSQNFSQVLAFEAQLLLNL